MAKKKRSKCLPCLVHDVKSLKEILPPLIKAYNKAIKAAKGNALKCDKAEDKLWAALLENNIFCYEDYEMIHEYFEDGIYELYTCGDTHYAMERK